MDEVFACQLHKILFRNELYCSKCVGLRCNYLQSYEDERMGELLRQGYKLRRWRPQRNYRS